MAANRFFGVNGVVAHGHVDVAVSSDHLSDMRGQTIHDGVGEKHPSKVVGCVVQRGSVNSVEQSSVGESLVK